MLTHQAGTPKQFTVQFVDAAGGAIVPASATMELFADGGEQLIEEEALSLEAEATSATFEVAGEFHELPDGSVRAFRGLVIRYVDSEGSQYRIDVPYVLTGATGLVAGSNAFGTFGEYAVILSTLPRLAVLSAASVETMTSALINAYHNMAQLRVDLEACGDEFADISFLDDLTDELLEELPQSTRDKLIRAALIEAEGILGGYPVEDRRRSGLMSHSAGESSHFLRPTRPLDLPVFRETAKALAPHVSYLMKVGR